MLDRKLYLIQSCLLFILMLGLGACSDKTFLSSTTSVSETASATVYTPLKSGWRVTYMQTEPENSRYYTEVTAPVTIAGFPGYTVRRTNLLTGDITYSYLYATQTAVYESQSTSNPGVKILESPFLIGHQWERFASTSGTAGQSDGDTTDTGGGGVKSSVPGEDYGQMTIVGRETVAAMDGHAYGNCLKVAWQTGEYSYNYYWYAAGIGLIKFESVTNALSASTGEVVSLMADFGQIEY